MACINCNKSNPAKNMSTTSSANVQELTSKQVEELKTLPASKGKVTVSVAMLPNKKWRVTAKNSAEGVTPVVLADF